MISLSVKEDTRELERLFRRLERTVIPRVTSRALNEFAAYARTHGSRAVAQDLRLPLQLIRKRLDKNGNVKGDRILLTRATRNRLVATLTVYVRGIPVTQIAGAQTRRGVRAKGGRLYVGAFHTRLRETGQRVVLKRFPQAGRYPTFLPRIGVKKDLEAQFERIITSPEGIAEYRRRWERLATLELERESRR